MFNSKARKGLIIFSRNIATQYINMSVARQPVSSLSSGSEMLSKVSSDATINQVCSSNKALIRFTSTAGNGVTTFFNVIPLKPPSCCTIRVNWTYYSFAPGNPSCSLVQITQVNQSAILGPVGQETTFSGINQTIGGNSLTYALNVSVNSLNVTINVSAPGPLSHVFEFEIFRNKPF